MKGRPGLQAVNTELLFTILISSGHILGKICISLSVDSSLIIMLFTQGAHIIKGVIQ